MAGEYFVGKQSGETSWGKYHEGTLMKARRANVSPKPVTMWLQVTLSNGGKLC